MSISPMFALSPSSFFARWRPMSVLLLLSSLLVQSALAGSYESAELTSSELQSGKRTLPYVSYQPWSYMKRAPAAPIIRFGKRSDLMMAGWGDGAATVSRNSRAALTGPLIRFGKRMPANAPLIRFGRRPSDSAPLIRFGKRAAPSGAPLIRFGRSWTAQQE